MYSVTARVMLLSLTLLLAGCGALVVSGAADNGYRDRGDGRTPEQVSRDASITSSLNREYVMDDLISAMDVKVDTYGGVVTLRGTVSSRRAADRAVSLARATRGVKQVISRLSVAQ